MALYDPLVGNANFLTDAIVIHGVLIPETIECGKLLALKNRSYDLHSSLVLLGQPPCLLLSLLGHTFHGLQTTLLPCHF
jgi:hypothetical protein